MHTDRSAQRYGRAIGAGFFTVFGAAWLGFAAQLRLAPPRPWLAWGLILVLAATLMTWVLRRVQRFRPPPGPVPPEVQRRNNLFNWINGGQWVVILIAGNVLANLGRGDWVIPMVVLVVGLHFLPLARLFGYPPHYLTGGAMMALALIYPFTAGPTSWVGPFGAGLLLWLSACWALTR